MKHQAVSKYILLGILLTVGFSLVFGIPTALVPNPWFVRMIKATPIDYVFLYLESALAGSYVTLALEQKSKGMIDGKCAVGGGVLGFLAFACPICNKLLVFLFGIGILLSYLQPVRLYLGILGIALLSYALCLKIQQIKSSA